MHKSLFKTQLFESRFGLIYEIIAKTAINQWAPKRSQHCVRILMHSCVVYIILCFHYSFPLRRQAEEQHACFLMLGRPLLDTASIVLKFPQGPQSIPYYSNKLSSGFMHLQSCEKEVLTALCAVLWMTKCTPWFSCL